MRKLRNIPKKRIVWSLLVVILLAGIIYMVLPHHSGTYMNYAKFCAYVDENQIREAQVGEDYVEFEVEGKKYYTDNPQYDRFREYLLLHNVEVTSETAADDILYKGMDLLFDVAFFGMLGALAYGVYNFKHKQFALVRTTAEGFEQIAGMENVKKDMRQLVDVMKHPKENEKLGIRQPHGILFAGPPGNGKTLFARALAKEAGMNFIATKATDFQSMYMSIGPAKVKALFKKARKHAPCIVFIDEFDGIGEKRTYAGYGIDKENNRIITSLLNELDGFCRNESGVLVIAATNNIKDLDPALIRAGRFDRKYQIGNPDYETRVELIHLYSNNRSMDSSIDIDQLANQFHGFSSAQIETIMNEACFAAASRNSDTIRKEDIQKAMEKVSCM